MEKLKIPKKTLMTAYCEKKTELNISHHLIDYANEAP